MTAPAPPLPSGLVAGCTCDQAPADNPFADCGCRTCPELARQTAGCPCRGNRTLYGRSRGEAAGGLYAGMCDRCFTIARDVRGCGLRVAEHADLPPAGATARRSSVTAADAALEAPWITSAGADPGVAEVSAVVANTDAAARNAAPPTGEVAPAVATAVAVSTGGRILGGEDLGPTSGPAPTPAPGGAEGGQAPLVYCRRCQRYAHDPGTHLIGRGEHDPGSPMPFMRWCTPAGFRVLPFHDTPTAPTTTGTGS